MARITFTEMTTAVALALESSAAFRQVQAPGTALQPMGEGIAETPTAQVYLEAMNLSATDTDRRTFGGRQHAGLRPVRQRKVTLHIDVYARQRSNLADDVTAVQELADVVEEVLESQTHKPYFNLDIEAFHYRLERVVFEYASVKYSGLRFVLDLTTM
jgi:hypothetical protein